MLKLIFFQSCLDISWVEPVLSRRLSWSRTQHSASGESPINYPSISSQEPLRSSKFNEVPCIAYQILNYGCLWKDGWSE